MARAPWIVSISLLVFTTGQIHGQGVLQRSRDGVHPTSTSAPSNSSSPSSGSTSTPSSNGNDSTSGSSSDSWTPDDLLIGGIAAGLVALAPFYGPIYLLNDNYETHMTFARHPYAGSYHAYQVLPEGNFATQYDPDSRDMSGKDWAMRILLENGNDFNGLNRLGGQIKFDHSSRLGLVSNWSYYRERLSCGCVDDALMGDTNITFRFAQHPNASFYSGLGFRMITDRQRSDYGFNFTYGGDLFPVRPFVVSGVFDAGNLGSAGVVHGRASLGAIYRGWEVFAGYDILRIGHTNLQGPMAGIRWWF